MCSTCVTHVVLICYTRCTGPERYTRHYTWKWCTGVCYTRCSFVGYAADHAQGKGRAKKNKSEVAALRAEVKLAKRTISIAWRHVKGHSGNVWNDRADELAKQGARSCTPLPPTEPAQGEHGAEATTSPRCSPAGRGGRVRWVTSTPTEAQRVAASRTRHGVLNASARRKQQHTRQELGELMAQSIKRIRADERPEPWSDPCAHLHGCA